MTYSQELKDAVLRRILPPNSEPVAKVAREEGIPEQTIRAWRNKSRKEGVPTPAKDNSETWSSQDKFLTVMETYSMNETELSEYARKKGLYVEQIKTWRDNCISCNGNIAKELSKVNKALKEEQKARKGVEKELLRKDKALAEAAALLILSKKANAIWGDKEEDQ